ncbi:DUF1552 domain-containing protein [Blastopirellula sp. JC732]|uniref:DUF1552 domain-containing protein n=1 Tax=Blastopirellula sediminis TaxID=2894196 RepID=A0A9X1MM70_9BACT|nr:DUF1552 domain-containing protein [Blastopirellula sediminis]MCC9609169.1 DUF1552 domain-containing protein [Blastopirellula sediminis]MCC9628054.1 DUF1552 domain-containing protein [Blastopirellula sediminis]
MSHFNFNRWRINRRHVLRGIGATLALPLMNCMDPGKMVAAENVKDEPALAKPKRSVFIYIPNGVNTLTWQIEKAGTDYELSGPLKSLEEHRQEITPISGLHHPNGIGQAHECDKIWLTGAKISQEGGAFRNSVSADQMMAEVTSPHTRFSSLEVAITGGTLAWSRDGIPLPAERRPKVIFDRLFGVEPGGADAAKRNLSRRGSVLDTLLEDADRFRKQIGTEDRNKLDEYLNAVRDVEKRTRRSYEWLDIPKPSIAAETKQKLARDIPQTDAGDLYRTIYDLMVLAIRTDMTRVITCMSGSESNGLAIPEIGVAQTRHELSHHNGDPEQLRRLTETDAFLAKQLSYFIGQLKSYQEENETLLDRTMVLFGSGMAYGHSHGNANLPMVLAGGSGLGLKHGQHVDYNLPKLGQYNLADARGHYGVCSRPVDSDAHLSNLLLTMMQKMDIPVDSFADSNGVISEIMG